MNCIMPTLHALDDLWMASYIHVYINTHSFTNQTLFMYIKFLSITALVTRFDAKVQIVSFIENHK